MLARMQLAKSRKSFLTLCGTTYHEKVYGFHKNLSRYHGEILQKFQNFAIIISRKRIHFIGRVAINTPSTSKWWI